VHANRTRGLAKSYNFTSLSHCVLQAMGAAESKLFQILLQPRRDDRARSLLGDTSVLAAAAVPSGTAAPFRPGGFRDTLAQTCLRMVAALVQVTR